MMHNRKTLFPILLIMVIIALIIHPVVSNAQEGDGFPQVGEDLPTILSAPLQNIREGDNPKLSTQLNQVLEAYNLYGSEEWKNHVDLTGLVVDNDTILLEIRMNPVEFVMTSGYMDANDITLRNNNAPGLYEIGLPVANLSGLASNPYTYFIRPARLVQFLETNAGASTTQGVMQSNSDQWHLLGVDGTGVTIALIDGYNSATIASLQASGDWPSGGQLTMVDVDGGGFGDLGEDHGMATLEIAYDMAPGATFIVYEALTVGDWYTAIGLADAAGADIISASLGAPLDGIGDGSAMVGSIAEAATNARANGVLTINAAGNSRQTHWGGLYNESGFVPFAGYAGSLDWGSSGNLNFGLYCYPIGWPLSVELFWDDWTDPVDHDYDVFLIQYDRLGNVGGLDVLASSTNVQDGSPGQTPQEYAFTTITQASGPNSCFGTGAAVAILVGNWSAASNRNLQVFTNGFVEMVTYVESSSLGFPADSASVFSVAAIDVTTHIQESYSSEGPILPAGGGPSPVLGPLAGPEKPDAASFANVDTESYGPGVFNGTSSATPHAAGMAALILENNPAFTVDQLEAELIAIASTGDNDLGTPGHDNEHGWGRLQFKLSPTAINLTNFYAYEKSSFVSLIVVTIGLTLIIAFWVQKKHKKEH